MLVADWMNNSLNDAEINYLLLFGDNNHGVEVEEKDLWKDKHFRKIYEHKLSFDTVQDIVNRKNLNSPFSMGSFESSKDYETTDLFEIAIDYSSRAYLCNTVNGSRHLAFDSITNKKIIKTPYSLINYSFKEGLPVVPFVNQKNVFYAFTVGCVLFYNDAEQLEDVIFFGKYTYNYFERQ